MIGLVKVALYECIWNSFLKWAELQEVLLDVEVALNNMPLSYVEGDVQLPIMTPNSLLFGQPNLLPELEPHHLEPGDLRKRAKYLRRCKEAVWQRWTREYLRGLRERHQLKHSARPFALTVGEVVLIKSEDRNRGRWRMGIVKELMPGRDGVVRAIKLRARKNYLERAVQHLYLLELSCNRTVKATEATLNAQVPALRPSRDAATAAGLRIKELGKNNRINKVTSRVRNLYFYC